MEVFSRSWTALRTPFPESFSDTDALLIGTARRVPTAAEKAALGDRAPLYLG